MTFPSGMVGRYMSLTKELNAPRMAMKIRKATYPFARGVALLACIII